MKLHPLISVIYCSRVINGCNLALKISRAIIFLLQIVRLYKEAQWESLTETEIEGKLAEKTLKNSIQRMKDGWRSLSLMLRSWHTYTEGENRSPPYYRCWPIMYEAVSCQCDTVGEMDDFALAENNPFTELFSFTVRFS